MHPILRVIILSIGGTFFCCLLALALPVAFWSTSPSEHLPSPDRIPEVARFPSPEEAEEAWKVVWRKLRRRHLALFFCAGLPVFAAVFIVCAYGQSLMAQRYLGWYWIAQHPLSLQPLLEAPINMIVPAASALAGRYVIIWALERRATRLLREHLISLGQAICLKCGYDLTGNVSGICPECGTEVVAKIETTSAGRPSETDSPRGE